MAAGVDLDQPSSFTLTVGGAPVYVKLSACKLTQSLFDPSTTVAVFFSPEPSYETSIFAYAGSVAIPYTHLIRSARIVNA